jgi:hypothetical protein
MANTAPPGCSGSSTEMACPIESEALSSCQIKQPTLLYNYAPMDAGPTLHGSKHERTRTSTRTTGRASPSKAQHEFHMRITSLPATNLFRSQSSSAARRSSATVAWIKALPRKRWRRAVACCCCCRRSCRCCAKLCAPLCTKICAPHQELPGHERQ